MTEQQQTQSTARGPAYTHARCACSELTEAVSEILGFSPSVKEHLHNSRIEFLKAMREAIDAKIDRLSNAPQKGTRVAVE